MTAAFDLRVKQVVLRHFATTGHRPALEETARALSTDAAAVRASYRRLAEQHLLVLDDDGASIRMAPPFSGVPTQHLVVVDGVHYHANCGWDALGIVAALRRGGTMKSRCEGSQQPLVVAIGSDGPAPSDWRFHCPLPAFRWWEDVVET